MNNISRFVDMKPTQDYKSYNSNSSQDEKYIETLLKKI
jgi:hypothetical protein